MQKKEIKEKRPPKLNLPKKEIILYCILFLALIVISILIGYLNKQSKDNKQEQTPINIEEEVTQEEIITIDDYEKIVLGKNSQGILRIEQYYYSSTKPNKNGIYFLFENEKDNGTYALTENLYKAAQKNDGSGTYNNSLRDPLLVNHEIYFLHGYEYEFPEEMEYNSFVFLDQLKKINIFSGEITTIDLEYEKEKFINAFYINNDTIYYLIGENCWVYYGIKHIQCNTELKSYDMKTKETKLLASNSTSRMIHGMNKQKDKIYLSWTGMDEGPFGIFQEYNLNTKKISTLGEFSYAYDIITDQIVPSTQASYDQHQKWLNLVYGIDDVQYILINNEKISFPNNEYNNDLTDTIGIRVFTN